MIKQNDLTKHLNQLFKPENFDDYCPNGLQVEGKTEIKNITFAVSATKESIEASIRQQSDALIVHHGLFWKFHGPKTITGPFATRIKPLIQHDINLYAYHLPLDGHPEVGNAVSLANNLSLINLKPFGEYKKSFTGTMGELSKEIPASEFKLKLESVLNHSVLHSSPNSQTIKSIGIITGGANSEWRECLKYNLDAYITGEMSEHDWHEAREAGVHFFAGGHHATEKFGIQNLMNHLKNKFPGIKTQFLDSDNPA
jgi:dinuclear metal center YbgI/SA1388 family protein